jgi:hypothetical protein
VDVLLQPLVPHGLALVVKKYILDITIYVISKNILKYVSDRFLWSGWG